MNFINIQHSHGVQALGYETTPYRTGYEEVIASRVSELFTNVASEDGFVIKVTDSIITVRYQSGIEKSIALGISHGVASGTIVPHRKVTNMKVDQTFKKGDILAYHPGFFTPSELTPNNVVYKGGLLANIALSDDTDTTDDGCTISASLAKRLTSPTTYLYGLTIDFDMIIHNLVKIGDVLTPDSLLCTMEHNLGEGFDKHGDAIQALSQLANNSPKCKVYGTVTEIEVIYYGKKENMSNSLLDIVDFYDKKRAKYTKLFNPEGPQTGKVDEPVGIAGKKLLINQVGIKIYVDSKIDMGDGDKLVIGNQLKTTCSRVDTDPMVAEDGTPIDGTYGYIGVSNRIVQSAQITGVVNRVLIELSKQMRQKYVKSRRV